MITHDRSYLIEGSRTGVLLVHGLSGTPVELRYIANGLARSGFTVSVPQLAGHCGTLEDLKATGWQDWYGSVRAAHAALRERCDTIIVGGLSMGAVLSLKLAAEEPERVHGIALFAPTLKLDGWSVPRYARLFDLVQFAWVADLFTFNEREPYGLKNKRFRAMVAQAIKGPDASEAGLPGTPGRSMLYLRRLTRQVIAGLPAIRQPTLLLHPREDDRASFASNAGLLEQRLGGRVRTVVLEDCYHVITLDQQKDVVLDETVIFVKGLERTRDRGNADRAASAPSPRR
jgi:carboxylesterase